MSEPLANLNGVTMPLSEVRVSALDRGFLFGDAIYEVLRVYAGRPWLEDEHFARLARSLEEVRIRGVDIARIRRRMRTLAAAKVPEATVYIQVTRRRPRVTPSPPGDAAGVIVGGGMSRFVRGGTTDRSGGEFAETSAGNAATSSPRTCWATCWRCRRRRRRAASRRCCTCRTAH
jgi:hypothetical protein